ncbi:undecaprenyl-phosphate glucose phosphotransferase [Lactonifactor sp. BIOML-A3]|uniref:undecaprenyl-phosphate glucose phosphotransferase n=1 Tax=unclassified Lactonifactor TaxID=2636670 RepID=UPI0012B10D11|nr:MULTISPECIES: undecaprenyl-phosphate glucose phosphotransferase [unclassified Lactonifactor]MRZ99929.1 undecaprenyl-phosphate glucose phosphotransferase [Lactonifactor sp. BIOML-A5]MSA07174.1 undecaprenyl-phosphate glucose phosphotransferase [Lactonifactor sp. BIOML-A4]MSA11353.1 undecaprenyl-phosphate glucose phosphotransferase [Lactonifactor sp. BIOML-A3]MSA15501.1 undecaprenyl-phosphate glucose phosphotransferase [Lactonifactor sp. BIOML-A2]MSA36107.1 undecaprenyl-phosphate glucose phosp
MIKDNQKHFNRLHVVIDAFVIAVSYWLAWFIKFESPFFQNSVKTLSFERYMAALVVIVPGYLILYYAFNLYTPKRVQGGRLEVSNIVKANTIGLFLLIVGLYLMREINFSRTMLFIFYGINIVAETIVRNAIRFILRDMRRRGLNQKHILLVGYSRAAEEYIDRIIQNPQWGYKVRGILDDSVEAGTEYKGIKVIGRIENLLVILPANRLDEIAITLGLSEYFRLEEIVSLCEKSGVHTKFIPDYNNIIPTKPYTEDILGLPVINIRYVPLSNTFNAMVKRLMDIAGSIVAIVLFSPVMLFTVIMIKITSPGPLIFKQERVGLHNRNFWMYKFRSMDVQPDAEEKKAWTVKDDPRVTNFGKLMRKTSIDELPQLFNILKGDMSLVGPRPERPFFVEKFREEIPRYMIKHQVRPGLTGWAQVNGYRGNTSIRKRIEYDLYYIENWTIGLDIKILFLTIFKGFVNKNAY